MLDQAAEGGYALAAVYVTSSETLNAASRGFAEAGADGIVQYTRASAQDMSGAAVRNAVLGERWFAQVAHAIAAASPVLVAPHTDHCSPSRVDDWLRPLLAESERHVAARQAPLFHSHMFDGSTRALDDNLRIAVGLLAECSQLDLVLEVECGVAGGEEDGLAGPTANRDKLYTTPDDVREVADVFGTGQRGRYLVAGTFGNVHGTYAPGNVVLRPEILRAGQVALCEAHPSARFRYVFHGSSGSSQQDLGDAISSGVVKVNLDTDAQHAFMRASATHVVDHWQGVLKVDGGLGENHSFDPRAWGAEADAAMPLVCATPPTSSDRPAEHSSSHDRHY